MNTMAIPEASPPLVTRAAPLSDAPDSYTGNLVKMPVRLREDPPAVPDVAVMTTLLDPRIKERALVTEMSRKIAQGALEVLSGARSVQQLSRWLDAKCLDSLTTRARLHAQALQAENRKMSQRANNVHALHHQPIVHSVHSCAVAPGIYETSLVVADAAHFRAIAMRFEETEGIWKVTALQIG